MWQVTVDGWVDVSAGWREEVWQMCRERVFSYRSADDQFNPYFDVSSELDNPRAACVRRDNLAAYLKAVMDRPQVVVIAEAPGPWGCRLSGVPITSESQLVDPDFPIDGKQASRSTEPYSEYSAGIFWRVMEEFFPRFLVWNAVPFHPHRVGQPDSIRAPRVRELRSFLDVTSAIVDVVKAGEVVALGRKAEMQLGWAGISCRYVRHPSQGGARAFEVGMQAIFGG